MGLIDEIKNTLTAAGAQLTASGHLSDTLTVTTKCQEQAKQLGLSAADVKAVYHHGTVSKNKPYLITKAYTGYSLTVSFFRDSRTGKPVIGSIRKWEKTY